ncbi:hypothetical protein BATDEDRAFT_35052 [Batrachochytrium dendrobatidis JAM81]|uniref:Glucose-6-phosphate 1-epimerase n=1 Tax=Batrachochytrium dendrobatidis (strain JAM81 / FGSC 10211) TaxID=684364 RepID=F4P2Q7_BATDJ|nr:glucose-6-phosphate 1-epimerase [Batrachochytrium dendrobatidis JAM81]EGF80059.1 hypothetical protein BATDEDRAFT_35052 [Batrachochytrium dendrobatidis JAM81]|eukprot:XP_006679088.1 hypothetical protein BATDEDRAFT_35052 [Batrachochytrium dendrobatidis JAM81]
MTVDVNPDFVTVTHAGSTITIYLWGATVTSWKYYGVENLFLSSKAVLDGSKPIRGGIPLVFPQFGSGQDKVLPQHGFARVSKWKYLGLEVENAAETTVRFGLTPFMIPEAQRALWPHDIASVGIVGLTGFPYVDKVANSARTEMEPRSIITIQGEVDRVYENVKNDYISIQGTGVGGVVWNPWVEKAKAMSDFDDSEFQQMVCVEVGNVTLMEVAAGKEWNGTQVLLATPVHSL